MRYVLIALLLTVQSTIGHAWSEMGHHVIAVMAFQRLEPAQQQQLIRLLQSHPRFSSDFVVPESTTNDAHWLIGRAGYWPDIARSHPTWNRPTWHYELGSCLELGRVSGVPERPGPAPDSATLTTQELHIAQAVELCRGVLSTSQSESDKAVALCWILHLVADAHQPCHAGSLYAESVFPEGDRGANSIRLSRGRNMHALWDNLLGRRFDDRVLLRRIETIQQEAPRSVRDVFVDTEGDTQDPQTWLKESRALAREFVYAPEVREPISVAMRSDANDLDPIGLTDDYLRSAGQVARIRAAQAADRLAAMLRDSL